jgi:hypothetical protein
LDNPCTTLNEVQYAITTDFANARCTDIAMVRFTGVVPNIARPTHTNFTFYPTLINDGLGSVTYDVFNDSWSGLISNIVQGCGLSLCNGYGNVWFDINSNSWTGLMENVLRGYGDASVTNGLGTIWSEVKCPSWATTRWKQTCIKPFSNF